MTIVVIKDILQNNFHQTENSHLSLQVKFYYKLNSNTINFIYFFVGYGNTNHKIAPSFTISTKNCSSIVVLNTSCFTINVNSHCYIIIKQIKSLKSRNVFYCQLNMHGKENYKSVLNC